MARVIVAVLLFLSTGCKTGSPNTLAGAAATTSLAIGAAAGSRAAGGCIAICTGETFCNPRSGLCEDFPCSGRCDSGEHCAQTLTDSRYITDGTSGFEVA